VAFNIHSGPLADEKRRLQLIQDFDVETLVRRFVGRLAIPAHGLVPPGLLGYEPMRRKSGSGSKRQNVSNIELKAMTHSIYDGAYSPLRAELFRSFQERGFTVRVEGTNAENLSPASWKEVDLLLMRWFGDYPDADTFFHGVMHSTNGFAGALCGSPEMDRLIEKGRTETHPQRRHDIYREAEQMIVNRALLLPLFHEQTYRFCRPEVQDFEVGFATQVVPYPNLWVQR
jgi:oligopeptide transport system substrate-binding protein